MTSPGADPDREDNGKDSTEIIYRDSTATNSTAVFFMVRIIFPPASFLTLGLILQVCAYYVTGYYIPVYFKPRILLLPSLTSLYILLSSSYFHCKFYFLSCYNLFLVCALTISTTPSLSKPFSLSSVTSHSSSCS